MKPSYEELIQVLRDYSKIFHELEGSGLKLISRHDREWQRLTMIEQATEEREI